MRMTGPGRGNRGRGSPAGVLATEVALNPNGNVCGCMRVPASLADLISATRPPWRTALGLQADGGLGAISSCVAQDTPADSGGDRAPRGGVGRTDRHRTTGGAQGRRHRQRRCARHRRRGRSGQTGFAAWPHTAVHGESFLIEARQGAARALAAASGADVTLTPDQASAQLRVGGSIVPLRQNIVLECSGSATGTALALGCPPSRRRPRRGRWPAKDRGSTRRRSCLRRSPYAGRSLTRTNSRKPSSCSRNGAIKVADLTTGRPYPQCGAGGVSKSLARRRGTMKILIEPARRDQ